MILILFYSIFSLSNFSHQEAFSQSDDVSQENIRAKFVPGYYDIIINQINSNIQAKSQDQTISYKSQYYDIVLITSKKVDFDTTEELRTAEQELDSFEQILLDEHGTLGTYKSHEFNYIIARVPVEEVPRIASYDNVFMVGDADRPLKETLKHFDFEDDDSRTDTQSPHSGISAEPSQQLRGDI